MWWSSSRSWVWVVAGRHRELNEAEETMVQVTSFDDEVGEEIVGVPEVEVVEGG